MRQCLIDAAPKHHVAAKKDPEFRRTHLVSTGVIGHAKPSVR
jgi:hypothetical protein